MTRSIALVGVLAVALLAGCARAPDSGSGDTGIAGTVRVGPTCPVEQAGSPCPDRALSTDLEILSGTSVIARVRSGDDGRFRVALEPGVYTIRSGSTEPPTLSPVQVRVPPTAFAGVTLRFDSGIR
jgi:hypothetical protein